MYFGTENETNIFLLAQVKILGQILEGAVRKAIADEN